MKTDFQPSTKILANRHESASKALGLEKNGAEATTKTTPKQMRRLAWNELVSQGDFIADGHKGFELWDGPSGFRANSFVKTIYRQVGG